MALTLSPPVDVEWVLRMVKENSPHVLHCIDIKVYVGLAMRSPDQADWRLSDSGEVPTSPRVFLLKGLSFLLEAMKLDQASEHVLLHKAIRFVREVVEYSQTQQVSLCAVVASTSDLPNDLRAFFVQTWSIPLIGPGDVGQIILYLLHYSYKKQWIDEFVEKNDTIFRYLQTVCLGRSVSTVNTIIERSTLECFHRLYKKLWQSMLHLIDDIRIAPETTKDKSSIWMELSKEDIDQVTVDLPRSNDKVSCQVSPTRWEDIGGIDK